MSTKLRFTPLNDKQIKAMPTARLKQYYNKKLRNYRAGFVCGCCQMYVWDIDPADEHLKLEHDELAAYAYKIRIILETRDDLDEVIETNNDKSRAKKLKSKNGGHQKKTHEKRRKSK